MLPTDPNFTQPFSWRLISLFGGRRLTTSDSTSYDPSQDHGSSDHTAGLLGRCWALALSRGGMALDLAASRACDACWVCGDMWLRGQCTRTRHHVVSSMAPVQHETSPFQSAQKSLRGGRLPRLSGLSPAADLGLAQWKGGHCPS